MKGNQYRIFIRRTDAEAPILWPSDVKSWLIGKRPWCWERLKAGGEGDDRVWDGCMASPTRWTWIWASSERWWRAWKPGVLQSTGLQRAGHEWVTEQQQQLNESKMAIFARKVLHSRTTRFVHTTSWCVHTCAPFCFLNLALMYTCIPTTFGLWIVWKKKWFSPFRCNHF